MSKVKAYSPYQRTVEQRLEEINKGYTLELAIEDRFTNLRIWKSRIHAPINPDNTEAIYMRLDRCNCYSVPLSVDTHKYLENSETPVKELTKFSFPTSIDNLNEIIEITKGMVVRHCKEW